MKLLTTLALIAFLPSLSFSAEEELKLPDCSDPAKFITRTEHTALVNGVEIRYSATTGYFPVRSLDETATLCLFYTAYEAEKGKRQRPVTFAFNGGPSTSSLWLHLGILGPKRVNFGDNGITPPRDQSLVPNEHFPIDATDIVLLDPAGTGFSYIQKGTMQNFTGVSKDVDSIASFIRGYVSFAKRWGSPKFLLGESYGGIRAARVAKKLQQAHYIKLDGLMMVGPALSFAVLSHQTANNLSYITYFPSLAVAAWHHGKIALKYQSLTVDQVYLTAKKFADTRLRIALERMGDLSADQLRKTAQKEAEMIGIPEEELVRSELKISDYEFYDRLLKKENKRIGRMDSRVVGATGTGDLSLSVPGQYLTAGINQYLREELNTSPLSPYKVWADYYGWDHETGGAGYLHVIDDLSAVLKENTNLKVLITAGYFDLACPISGIEYAVSQIPGGPSIRSRVSVQRYEGGHMSYFNLNELGRMKNSFASFIRGQTGENPPVQGSLIPR